MKRVLQYSLLSGVLVSFSALASKAPDDDYQDQLKAGSATVTNAMDAFVEQDEQPDSFLRSLAIAAKLVSEEGQETKTKMEDETSNISSFNKIMETFLAQNAAAQGKLDHLLNDPSVDPKVVEEQKEVAASFDVQYVTMEEKFGKNTWFDEFREKYIPQKKELKALLRRFEKNFNKEVVDRFNAAEKKTRKELKDFVSSTGEKIEKEYGNTEEFVKEQAKRVEKNVRNESKKAEQKVRKEAQNFAKSIKKKWGF